jgi:hypothetical protein
MNHVSIAVAIPTRNRADMAINAIQFLRAQPGCDLRIFVSDNSSIETEVRRLVDFCSGLDDPDVIYERAPGSLGQGASWDWAVRQALARTGASHATVHYDRKIIRPGEAAALFGAAARFPDKVVTYLTDFVAAEPPPLRLWQVPWTGKLYRLKTSRTVEVSARGDALDLGQMLPILSNCIVPRAVVDSIVERFGTLCDSTTADSCFAYRFCALHDDFLHLDRPLSLLYGSHRSAAIGYLSGGGGDFADYRETWRGDTWLDAGMIPGLNLGYNMLFHEYELVRRALGGARLPPLDRDGCLRDLGRGLSWIRDPAMRARMRTVLEEHGWRPESARASVEARPSLPRRAYRRIRQSAELLLADRFNKPPRSITGFRFRSDEQALRYAVKYPSRPTGSTDHLAIAEPLEVETGVQ